MNNLAYILIILNSLLPANFNVINQHHSNYMVSTYSIFNSCKCKLGIFTLESLEQSCLHQFWKKWLRIIQGEGVLCFIIVVSLCWILHNRYCHKVTTTLNSPSNTLIVFCNWNVFSIFSLGSHLDGFFCNILFLCCFYLLVLNSNKKLFC